MMQVKDLKKHFKGSLAPPSGDTTNKVRDEAPTNVNESTQPTISKDLMMQYMREMRRDIEERIVEVSARQSKKTLLEVG